MAQTPPTFHTINPLPDGSRVHLRAIRPEDREALLGGFQKLSPESRRNRFLDTKRNLSGKELDFLTLVDFSSHVALVAEIETDNELVPVAVGRFVRDPVMPEHAEFALTVADAWQGRGIGKVLLRHLIDCARGLGVEYFDATLFTENRPMLQLLRHSGLALQANNRGGIDTVSLHLATQENRPVSP